MNQGGMDGFAAQRPRRPLEHRRVDARAATNISAFTVVAASGASPPTVVTPSTPCRARRSLWTQGAIAPATTLAGAAMLCFPAAPNYAAFLLACAV